MPAPGPALHPETQLRVSSPSCPFPLVTRGLSACHTVSPPGPVFTPGVLGPPGTSAGTEQAKKCCASGEKENQRVSLCSLQPSTWGCFPGCDMQEQSRTLRRGESLKLRAAEAAGFVGGPGASTGVAWSLRLATRLDMIKTDLHEAQQHVAVKGLRSAWRFLRPVGVLTN